MPCSVTTLDSEAQRTGQSASCCRIQVSHYGSKGTTMSPKPNGMYTSMQAAVSGSEKQLIKTK